ncbi:hypothetical protein CVIRNUC_008775 [Coccomyxa viridis]|uniref:CID domain-containing protein n=1 Tax=Coccomyxa viridis TaxID=1274662 RepID=A0AAV1IH81_9CHLO|nr:hypothetical protein CVIRNUC_008775 [Coccomyxa viridis]
MADQQALQEFVNQYATELNDLTFNSKALVNTLTMLAGDNIEAASSIAAAIEKHILTCAPPHKLYALYLVDSIAKNIGTPYTSLFASNMPQVFANVWSAAPQAQASLRKLLATWTNIFPEAVLAAVASHIGGPAGYQEQALHTSAGVSAQLRSLTPPPPSPPHMHQPTAGVGQQQVSAQSGVLPSYLLSHPQTAFEQSSAPLPRPQQPLDPRQRGRAAASSSAPAAPSSRATGSCSSKKTGQPEPLPDISEEELPLSFVDRRRLDFSAERMKAEDPQVLRELLACSLALRPKHVDRKFLHRRRMRGRSTMSQQWFVNTDNWIAGTAADMQAAPVFFDIEGKQSEEQQEVSIPADDSQPVCALSGERFDTFWDDAHEEWRFRDAVRLNAEQAARYGVPSGTIVKVSCLSSSPEAADAIDEAPGKTASQAVQELPSIKEEEVPSEQQSNGNEGVKREADETEDAQAVLKRIKVEPA